MGAIRAAAIRIEFDLPKGFLDTHKGRNGFILVAAFLGAFLFIRTSARLMRSPKVPWWPGSVETAGGLHLHHLVWGIVLILLTGFLNFALTPKTPWSEILAAGFGIGAGLTLDEFALWIHLDDVYWSREGRSSIDAVVVATLIGGMIVLGLAPFDTNDASPGIDLLLVVAIDVLMCVVVIAKGRLLLGLIGVFIPAVSFFTMFRLAAPGSWWARRRYPEGSRKLMRAEQRFAKARARHERALDAIGGRPATVLTTPGDSND